MAVKQKYLRLAFFAAALVFHLGLLFFIAFTVETAGQGGEERANVMKLTDIEEAPPPPPPPNPEQRIVEALAETMIAVETNPDIVSTEAPVAVPERGPEIEYLPMHLVSKPPSINEREIRSKLVYPPIALRSNIEGLVHLELFVDRDGVVRRITVLREDPPGRGFGDAAIRALEGLKGVPAEANGTPVAARFRYLLRFTIR
ncbi:MAG: energy transducer TonB [Spirochaetaceae bacterium]|jgi:protein TonB|nr:energy transducer TonB [Spirochaetaceae bacterium]